MLKAERIEDMDGLKLNAVVQFQNRKDDHMAKITVKMIFNSK